jgi:hypothetical protein
VQASPARAGISSRLEVGPYRHVLPAIADLLDVHRIDLLQRRLETLDFFFIERVRIAVDVLVLPSGRKPSIRSMEKNRSAHWGAVTLWNTFNGFLQDKVQELCPELGLALNFRETAGKLVNQHWETLRRELADVVEFDCEAIKDAIDRESQAAKEICNASLVSALAGSPPAKPGEGEGNDGAGSKTVEPKPLSDAAREAVLRQLEPAVRKAYRAFHHVASKVEKRPEDLEDRDAHDWLKENGIDPDKGDLGDLMDYKPPKSLDTFRRYLSTARDALGENKYTPRAGRSRGPSVARGDEIEYQKGDEE